MELDEYINLEARVSGRMVLLDISATGEENVIEQDAKEMNDLEYRRRQLMQLQDTVLDLEDMSGGVSITDLTLNDFRMDLSNYIKSDSEVLEHNPIGLFVAVSNKKEPSIPTGTIFCLKDVKGNVQVDKNYPLSPYFLVFVADNNEIIFSFTQAKKTLDVIKALCLHNQEADQNSLKIKGKKADNHYASLLEKAVESIVGKSEEKGVESLFNRGGTLLSKETSSSVNDFEVMSYFVITD